MLKDQIGPALRALGMRGSGQNFKLPTENGDFALLGFQKDSWDETMQFTANVAFYSGSKWHEALARNSWLPTVPTASTMYAVADLQEWKKRVGELMDPPHDHWWTIQSADDVPAVADHVVAVVRDAVLPQLRARRDGNTPPVLPTQEMGPIPDCPAPTCAYPPVAWVENADLGGLASMLTGEGAGDHGLDAVERRARDRARLITVPRTQAWKVLHISRARLDAYADRIGAGDALTFVQLLAVDLLGTDDMLAPPLWPEATEAVAGWAARLPDADPEMALVIAEGAAVLLPLIEALTRTDPALGVDVVQPLMPATQHLLEELGGAGLV